MIYEFWLFGLIVLEICTIILVGINLLNIELLDFIVQSIILIELITLSIFAYTIVKRVKGSK